MTTVHDVQDLASAPSRVRAKFPTTAYQSAAAFFDAYAEQTAKAASSIDPVALDAAADMLLAAYIRGAGVFSCGNGGSAAIANHLQCDHVKGVRNMTDLAPRVVSLSANIELMTAIANDVGYEDVFAYQLESLAGPGDILIAISSSGRSPNIVRAVRWARDHDVRTIALTGFDGGDARTCADVSIHVEGANYGIIEDAHQTIMHALAQYIRQSRMTAHAISASVF